MSGREQNLEHLLEIKMILQLISGFQCIFKPICSYRRHVMHFGLIQRWFRAISIEAPK